MSDVKRCPCRGSNDMCGCQNGPHPVRQDPDDEITALRARLEAVEKERLETHRDRDKWFGLALDNKHRAECAEAEVARLKSDRAFILGFNHGFEEGQAEVTRLITELATARSGIREIERLYYQEGKTPTEIAANMRAKATELIEKETE